jgi:hypothetical protein
MEYIYTPTNDEQSHEHEQENRDLYAEELKELNDQILTETNDEILIKELTIVKKLYSVLFNVNIDQLKINHGFTVNDAIVAMIDEISKEYLHEALAIKNVFTNEFNSRFSVTRRRRCITGEDFKNTNEELNDEIELELLECLFLGHLDKPIVQYWETIIWDDALKHKYTTREWNMKLKEVVRTMKLIMMLWINTCNFLTDADINLLGLMLNNKLLFKIDQYPNFEKQISMLAKFFSKIFDNQLERNLLIITTNLYYDIFSQ